MKNKWLFIVVPLSVLFVIIEGFLLKLDLIRCKDEIKSSDNIPIMRITLHNTSLEEIHSNSKDIKYEGNDLQLIFDDEVLEFSDVQIKGRGNSTWSGDKRPYQIKFKNKVDLLGLGARKNYILLANAFDDSLLRNAIMFKMADMIEEKYRMVGEFVQLDIDGGYRGLYYLTSKVEVGKGSVDLRDKYGIMMELDTLHEYEEDCYFSGFDECFDVKDAVYEDDEEVLAEAVADFMKDYNRFEISAKKGDFKAVKDLIDVKTLAEYFLISEFAVNPDAFVSSFNFYKDGKNDIIHVGPLWDYDFAFSNRNWSFTVIPEFYSPTNTMIQRESRFSEKRKDTDTTKFMYYLIDIPEFRGEVERIFQKWFSGKKNEFMMWILSEATRIKDAALSDSDRWGKDGELFYREMKYLIDWLSKRYDHMEQEYGRKEWDFRPGVI